jgi:hypothetical protein
VLGTATLRVLDARDRAAVDALLARDPVADCFVASRVAASSLDPARLGGELWGWLEDGRLVSLCYAGANLVPAQATPAAIEAFAERALRRGRRCSSVVGPQDAVELLWARLRPSWGPGREVRRDQPLMECAGPPLVDPDPRVRRVRPHELGCLLPAAVAMFTEEVGVSPLAHGGGGLYRARLAELIERGRAFARIDDGRVVFKAEVAAVTEQVCQVQGVWVDPRLRGRGHGTAGMAAVVALAACEIAPVVSLYVNAHNAPARAAYDAVGFTQVGAFMTVLF